VLRAEDRRFDVDEAEVAEVVSHLADDAVAQHQCLLHVAPSQVEVAMFEPQFFVRQVLTIGARARRAAGGFRFVQQLKPVTRSSISPLAGLGFAMPAGRSQRGR